MSNTTSTKGRPDMTVGQKVIVGATLAAGPALLIGAYAFPPLAFVYVGLAVYNACVNPNPHYWGRRP